jgi:hypothetical protein
MAKDKERAVNDQETGWVSLTLRLRPSQAAALDAIVDQRRSNKERASRQSVLETWADRGIREAKRAR